MILSFVALIGGDQRRRSIHFVLAEHRPGHPDQLVRQGNNHDILMRASQELSQPMVQPGSLFGPIPHHGSCSWNEQRPQVVVSSFADAQQLLFAAGGVLSWNHSHPRRQVSPFPKPTSVANRSNQRGRRHGADTGDGRESLTSLVLLHGVLDRGVHLLDVFGQLFEFQLEFSQQQTERAGQLQVGILENFRQRPVDVAPSFRQDGLRAVMISRNSSALEVPGPPR